jgi:TolA-binding protein
MTNIPTLEALMNGNNPYELVDSPFAEGKIEAWRAQSIATGVGGALAAMHQLYQLVRNDAADAAARADEAQAREALVEHLCDQVAAMQERINRLADALEERQRADEEASRHQRRLDEEVIELPPDISEKQTLAPPAKIGDDTPAPSGELHAVTAKEEPSLEDADNVGDLPKELADPPDPVPEPRGRVYPQPVAISLNKE